MKLVTRFFRRAGPVDWEVAFVAELPKLFNYFRFHGLDDDVADDLTATTVEKAWRARDTYRPDKASISTWLLTIARNVQIDYLRTIHADLSWETVDEQFTLSGQPTGLEEVAQQGEEIEILRRLLLNLPERERNILALKYGAEMTNRAITQMTGL